MRYGLHKGRGRRKFSALLLLALPLPSDLNPSWAQVPTFSGFQHILKTSEPSSLTD
ncbi:rCG63379 [Rattus norvegicus]|uniref:RCG63379 n=1 Tax=Rattus norvegicus TaxID=10116 RepID=A6KB25_RAT|nr:rCG63379 [Rattus norvegicus]